MGAATGPQDMKPILILATSALIISTTIVIQAQTPDAAAGAEIGSVVKRTPSIVAILKPMQDAGTAVGRVGFFPSGENVGANGRIEGLEPNKRYRLVVNRLITLPTPERAPSQAPPPMAGQPNAPKPNAPSPNAGQPDGTSRPGAPGAGVEGSSTSGNRNKGPAGNAPDANAAGDLGVLTSDAKGTININSTVRKATLDEGPLTVMGCSLVLWMEPAGTSQKIQIATGTIESTAGPSE